MAVSRFSCSTSTTRPSNCDVRLAFASFMAAFKAATEASVSLSFDFVDAWLSSIALTAEKFSDDSFSAAAALSKPAFMGGASLNDNWFLRTDGSIIEM